jgi:hypothetical protein
MIVVDFGCGGGGKINHDHGRGRKGQDTAGTGPLKGQDTAGAGLRESL